ncbi:MAG TPA: GMC family oxidoreductase [Flavobacteriia bacterium]|nr:GMC family oxidoreductase [Flavobacteriia bacterium]
MDKKYDVCVVGSGAGAGPIIYTLSKAGFKVLVLEKGPWFKTEDFTKDEITAVRRSVYTPNLKDEPQVLETLDENGNWIAKSNAETGNDFWNGNCVGGSSNFMSGYFNRLKPNDFKLKTIYGTIKGANVEDWPIIYEDLEPYYAKVEQIVGVSGKVVNHKFQEPRSTKDFPFPPLQENSISQWIDSACKTLKVESLPLPRAILSRSKSDRNACYYSNFCGSYGCASNAKGSSRAALINEALKTGNCKIIPNAKVFHLKTDGHNSVTEAHYYDKKDTVQKVKASIFVVAAQAIETSRLLLMSKNKEFPNGLANNSGNVGKNLIFSAGGSGYGHFYYDDLTKRQIEALKKPGVFVNRTIHQWYEITDLEDQKLKGGTIDFLFEHANATKKAIGQKWDFDGSLLYGKDFKQQLKFYFTRQRRLNFEVFADWLPTDNCFVTLDPKVKDKWQDPVARIRLGYHPHDIKIGTYLAKKGEEILQQMGAKDTNFGISGSAPPNLVAGGCRFGNNPKKSVLNKNCKAHEVKNLFITDASFMPTGGSVTYTWTIYANSFRVADWILEKFKK